MCLTSYLTMKWGIKGNYSVYIEATEELNNVYKYPYTCLFYTLFILLAHLNVLFFRNTTLSKEGRRVAAACCYVTQFLCLVLWLLLRNRHL
jgi:hypothetical protein